MAVIDRQRTPFPTRPTDVVALGVQEFTPDLDEKAAPSLDAVCSRFVDDENRAFVWLIRFRALKAWSARADSAAWLRTGSGTSKDVCAVAARFALNDKWEFDERGFGAAIDKVVSQRSGTHRGLSIFAAPVRHLASWLPRATRSR